MLDISFQIPILFVLLCFTLGTSVFYGLGAWCIAVNSGNYEGQSMASVISKWLLRGLIIIHFFPIFVKIYTIGQHNPYFSVKSEISALTLLLAGYVFYQYRQNHLKFRQIFEKLVFEVIKLLQLFLSIVVIWGLSVFIGLAVYLLSAKAAAILPIFEPPRDTAMIIVGLWLIPFIVLYQKIQRKSEAAEIKTPEHFRFYMLLGPVLLGILFFMAPLIVEKYVTSDAYKEMLNRKPPLERV